MREVFLFAEFELHLPTAELRRGGEVLRVPALQFALLSYLVRNKDRVVRCHELLSEVWRGAVVTKGALRQAIWELRRVLDDDAQTQAVIRTARGHGYRFVAPLRGSALDRPLMLPGPSATRWELTDQNGVPAPERPIARGGSAVRCSATPAPTSLSEQPRAEPRMRRRRPWRSARTHLVQRHVGPLVAEIANIERAAKQLSARLHGTPLAATQPAGLSALPGPAVARLLLVLRALTDTLSTYARAQGP